MNQSNLVLTGKGGVGKSFVAWLLGQYGVSRGYNGYFADTDPINATFAAYEGLHAQYIQISDASMKIDRRKFDDLAEVLAYHDGYSVVDTGSGTFIPLMSYITENKTLDLLRDNGCSVVIHAPIVGGAAMSDTVLGLKSILENTSAEVVIWENKFFGTVDFGGKHISETQIFRQFESRIKGVVTIEAAAADTLGADLRVLLTKRLLLGDAGDAGFGLAARQRMLNFQRDIFSKLQNIGL